MTQVAMGVLKRRDRAFYSGFAIGAILLVFAGFAPSYYLRGAGSPPIATVVHLHAIVFSAWMTLFAAQTLLVAGRRTDLHRRLGWISIALAAAMLVTGYRTAIEGARSGWVGFGIPRDDVGSIAFLTIGLGDLVVFTAFFTMALLSRHHPEAHKRWMILATIGGALPPAFGRLLPNLGPAALALLAIVLLAGPLYDLYSRRTVHRVYRWGIPGLLATYPLRVLIGASGWWRSVAEWWIQ
jgi:hypothetical protein